jgi:uncharacterized coiled-coil protein SlyX
MDGRTDRIEERLAHLILAVEDLSTQMRAQWERLDRLERQVDWLIRRERGRLEDPETGVRIED